MTLEELYREYKNLVYNLALQYSQSSEDAEEITQDVFLAIHQNLQKFQEKSSLQTWVYRIAINKSLDFLKAKQASKRSFLMGIVRLDKPETIQPATFNHPGVLLEQKEGLEGLFKAINQLNDQQKTVIILLKVEGRSQKEVAEIMEVSAKAVESLFQRAKKNLAKILNTTEG